MKKIALEEAFSVDGVEEYTPQLLSLREFRQCEARLRDLTDMRIRAMDEGELEMSVLSATSPSIQGIRDPAIEADTARRWNDYVAEAISGHTDRLRAFACLPMRDPQAAIAELQLGALKGCTNGAVFVIGTGVGGGLVINGQLVRGIHCTAGEYSFVNTNADDWQNADKTMALQCSVTNLLRWYRARKNLPEDAPLNGRIFFEAANAGEPEALEVLERFCKAVAVQIYNLTVLLDVEKVAIGGGISKQPLLLDSLRRVYAGLFASRGDSPYMIGLPRTEIVPCHFSSEANQVGALYACLHTVGRMD